MKKETFFCDKCNKETPEKKLKTVAMLRYSERKGYIGTGAGRPIEEIKLDLCTICLKKLGFIELVLDEDKVTAKELDTKEKLYEIMCDLIAEIGIPIQQ